MLGVHKFGRFKLDLDKLQSETRLNYKDFIARINQVRDDTLRNANKWKKAEAEAYIKGVYLNKVDEEFL